MSVLVIDGQAVGVYLRTSSRRNKDGSTVRYLSSAHNQRSPGGPSVARVLLPLGREDRLDVDALRRLVGSINRYLGEDAGSDAAVQVGAAPGGGLTITDSRPAGGAWLLDGLWRQLGIGTARGEVLGPRRFTTDVERAGPHRRGALPAGHHHAGDRGRRPPPRDRTGRAHPRRVRAARPPRPRPLAAPDTGRSAGHRHRQGPRRD